MEDGGDEWIAMDKLYHFLFCFSLSLLFSSLSSLSRYPFLRRRSLLVGSLVSLAAGAAKEAADEVGIFRSSGASPKDAVADLLGTAIASVVLLIYKRRSRTDAGEVRGPSLA